MTTVFGERTQAVDPTDDALIEVAIDADRIKNFGAIFEQPGQYVVDVADRKCIVGTEIATCADGPCPTTVPGLASRIAIAHEQQIFALRPTGHQHRDRLRFAKTRQVMEIAVLSVRMFYVVVTQVHGCGRHDRDRVATHRFHQLPTTTREFLARDAARCCSVAQLLRISGVRRARHRRGRPRRARGSAPIRRTPVGRRFVRTRRVRRTRPRSLRRHRYRRPTLG